MSEEVDQKWPEKGDIDYPFVVQVHFRGRSAHHDFRTSFDEHLEGWTIFSQPEDVVDEEPSSLEQAKGVIEEVDWTWLTESKTQVTAKARQPEEWLKFEGNFEPDKDAPEQSGLMAIADEGTLRYGARKPWFFEYFLSGEKYIGRTIFRQVGGPEGQVGFWVSWSPQDKTPYVFSKGAISDAWVPPKGWSALPSEIKNRVPATHRYWEQSSKRDRIQLRDELVEILSSKLTKIEDYPDGKTLGLCSHCDMPVVYESEEEEPIIMFTDVHPATLTETKEFFLVHHFWKGPEVINADATIEHVDLFIPPDLQIVLNKDPREGDPTAVTAKPYRKDFWLKGDRDAESIKPGQPGNPTRNIPAWVDRIDNGRVEVLEDGEMLKRFVFKGKKFNGSFTLEREDPRSNIWSFSKSERPGETKAHLSKGEFVEMYLPLTKLTPGENFLDVHGVGFSYGTWNGIYFSPEVVFDRFDRILDIPVALISHRRQKNVGKVVKVERRGDNIHVVTRIEGEENVNEVLELDEKGLLQGFSLELLFNGDERNIAKKIVEYQRIVIVPDPACRVCTVVGIAG